MRDAARHVSTFGSPDRVPDYWPNLESQHAADLPVDFGPEACCHPDKEPHPIGYLPCSSNVRMECRTYGAWDHAGERFELSTCGADGRTMIPIHELLNRIRWDSSYGQADFEIGYFDRVDKQIIRVPMREIFFASDDHFSFDLYDRDGELHSIPLHRIKQVFRNGELIWHREH